MKYWYRFWFWADRKNIDPLWVIAAVAVLMSLLIVLSEK